MPHKRRKSKKTDKPFFTVQAEVASALAADRSAQSSDGARPLSAVPDLRDWVQRERDDFIDARPHLKSLGEVAGRDSVVLMNERLRAKDAEGLLSEGDFRSVIEQPRDDSDGDRSLIDVLRERAAFAENRRTEAERMRTICPAEMYVLYATHRQTPRDALLAQFRTAEGRERMLKIVADCQSFARELRWVAQLSDCGLSDHPMPDDMRAMLLRAAGGSPGTRNDGGWLAWFARWLNEAAARFEREVGGKSQPKHVAFQRAWHELAIRKTGDPLSEVGRRLFRICFPDSTAYTDAASYGRRVRQILGSSKNRPRLVK